MTTTGVNQLLAKYERMGAAGTPMGKIAARTGGEIIKSAYQTGAPVGPTGRTAKAIRLSVRVKSKVDVTATVAFNRQVFANTKRKSHKGNPYAGAAASPFYVAWTNQGHFAGKRVKGKMKPERYRALSELQGRKWIAGSHWIAKARDKSTSSAREAMLNKLRELIDKASAGNGSIPA